MPTPPKLPAASDTEKSAGPESEPPPVKPRRPAKTRPEPKYPHLDGPSCSSLYDRWTALVGAIAYPRFRRALGRLYATPDPGWTLRDALGTVELYASTRATQYRTPEELVAQWQDWIGRFRLGPEHWGAP